MSHVTYKEILFSIFIIICERKSWHQCFAPFERPSFKSGSPMCCLQLGKQQPPILPAAPASFIMRRMLRVAELLVSPLPFNHR